MYNEGDVTHFGQVMEHCRARACWDKVMESSDYGQRLSQVAEFNRANRCVLWGPRLLGRGEGSW